MNGLYMATTTSLGGDGMFTFFCLSSSYMAQNDQLPCRTDRFVDSFPAGLQVPFNLRDNNSTLKECPTADNVKHFFDLFTNYQGHWFCMHMSSFAFLRAYDDLITAISCVGAVYSNRTDLSQVQGLVKLSGAAIERTSRIQQLLQTGLASNKEQTVNNAIPPTDDMERFQTVLILLTVPIWERLLDLACALTLACLLALRCRFGLPIGLEGRWF